VTVEIVFHFIMDFVIVLMKYYADSRPWNGGILGYDICKL